ncbi:hypothetical protein [uncultured Roseobacter sp.]|uniref:hypothetical protein n=1 Tax=uncultured Roseobacter sp. TaxID=114847 RepID=UPI0026126E94|nr:hypothetical protein [uncultured Roseobacter sp.]
MAQPKSGDDLANPKLALFEHAMEEQKVMLPDDRIVSIERKYIARCYDDDVWCDDFDGIIDPEYDQGIAMFIETVVNAGLCRTSGTARFNFVLQNLNLKRATGDLFDWDCILVDRHASSRDWRKEKTICDAFSKHPRRDMNRLKERIRRPRSNDLCMSKDDQLLWRVCYLSLARKVFLARAGYPDFCQQTVL